ncbi:MerR family transcriptional regulator [Brevundimonas sp. Leaf363]|uniref:MerR family transcriptional regulator n=1 Tax=Brevundimonas sp. Leaf363 TaxID=1736353 RepID=UPI000702207B|nr:MerR family transcriptional regulator [Brevundimonas sp. Leaf363]KQS56231.1 MerR family transcriptional regulator [Brevundimonas sp. Leaf363]
MAKGANAFRSISEAADEVGAPQHVLRFWETKFPFVTPVKRAGGRRFYRPQDIAVLKGVRRLLHDEGLTIKGVLKLHAENGIGRVTGSEGVAPAPTAAAMPSSDALDLARLRDRLDAARTRLLAALDA